MDNPAASGSASFREGGAFPPTHWSQVLAARDDDASRGAAALESLCRAYWPAIYAYVRREGRSPAEAQDLTQEFFSRFVERDFLSHLRHQNGRFRSFLLAFLKHFLQDVRTHERAQKRGHGLPLISLDELAEEERLRVGPTDTLSPDQIYDRRWALAVLGRAALRFGEECHRNGDGRLYEVIKDLAPGERGESGYAALAQELDTTEGGLKSAVHRLRQRHQEILREEIAQTVAHPGEVDDEIRNLIAIVAG